MSGAALLKSHAVPVCCKLPLLPQVSDELVQIRGFRRVPSRCNRLGSTLSSKPGGKGSPNNVAMPLSPCLQPVAGTVYVFDAQYLPADACAGMTADCRSPDTPAYDVGANGSLLLCFPCAAECLHAPAASHVELAANPVSRHSYIPEHWGNLPVPAPEEGTSGGDGSREGPPPTTRFRQHPFGLLCRMPRYKRRGRFRQS